MISTTDARLKKWVGDVIAGARVRMDLAQHEPGEQTVSLYLLRVSADGREHQRSTLRLGFWLEYLLTVSADQAETAHEIFENLLVEASLRSEFEVLMEPLSPELWLALGAAPQPCFVLRVPAEHERTLQEAPHVRSLTLRAGLTRTLHGRVLGPSGQPISGARVAAGASAVRTDRSGRFRVAVGVEREKEALELSVRAKGHVINQAIPRARVGSDEAITIHFDPARE